MSSPTRQPISSDSHPHLPPSAAGHTPSRVARGTLVENLPVTGLEGMFNEPARAKWSRRALTIPGLFLITGLYGVLMPLLLAYALVSDVFRKRKHFLLARFHLFIFGVLAFQCWSLFLLAGSWLYTRFLRPEDRMRVNRRVEIFAIPIVIGIIERIYGMEIITEDIECCKPGPILLLSRHASILDTILPIKLLGEAHDMGMRIVQKHELLYNPTVDLASHRMPRAFIKRGSGDPERQVAHMKHLLQGIGRGDALVVFPEGSRFTPEKKERIVAKIAQSNPIAADRANRLQTVLPVRPAGTIALMDERSDMDVVFLAHTGLEGANRLEDFVGGALYKRKVKMKFWRVRASQIPKGRDERIAWLHDEWAKVDRWILENRD